MSRSVKIVHPPHSHPTTVSFVLRTLIVIALTIDLTASEEPSPYYLPIDNDAKTNGSIPGDFSSSLSDDRGEQLAKHSGFNLKNRDFELTYKVYQTVNDKDERFIEQSNNGAKHPANANRPLSDDELIQKAIRDGVFLPAKRWDPRNDPGTGFNGERIDDGSDNPIIPKVKPECDTTTVCQETEYYPTKFVEEIVKGLQGLRALASSDIPGDPGTRINEDIADRSLCQSSERIWQPRSIRKNLKDKNSWHYVINVQDFEQAFLIANCENADQPCESIEGFTAGLPFGYRSVCRQHYINRKVLVLSRDNSSAIVDSFPIPTSCCCHIIFDATSRIGGSTANNYGQSRSGPFGTRGHRHHRGRQN